MPRHEIHKPPELVFMVGPSCNVLGDDVLDFLGIQVSGRLDPILRQEVAHERLQIRSQPQPHWHGKPQFPAM